MKKIVLRIAIKLFLNILIAMVIFSYALVKVAGPDAFEMIGQATFGSIEAEVGAGPEVDEVTEPELVVIEPEIVESDSDVEAEPEVEEVVYFDVPLSEELQDHIFATCESYGIDPALVIAVIQKESVFDASAVGDYGRSLGLMQIQPQWFTERMAELGLDNLLDPYQNVTLGVDYLAELLAMDRGLEWALMAYNGGHAYANSMVAGGSVSEYVREVISNSESFGGE